MADSDMIGLTEPSCRQNPATDSQAERLLRRSRTDEHCQSEWQTERLTPESFQKQKQKQFKLDNLSLIQKTM